MLDSKPEARGQKSEGCTHLLGQAARPPLHMGPELRGADGRKSHAGRMINHIQGSKKTDGGKENWPLEVAMGRPEREALLMAVFSQNTQKPGHHLEEGGLQGRLEIYRKAALKVLKFF